MLRERLGGNHKRYLPITGCVSIDHGNLNLHTDFIFTSHLNPLRELEFLAHASTQPCHRPFLFQVQKDMRPEQCQCGESADTVASRGGCCLGFGDF